MELPEHVRRAIYSGPIPVIRDWQSLPVRELTMGEKVCKFISDFCVVPEGSLVGKTVTLDVFQVAFILAVYDNPHDTSLAIFSVARKNAKTALIAFLMLAHIVGPLAKQNSRLNSGAMSRQQAAEVYNYAAKSAQLSPRLRDLVHCTPSSKTILGLPMNVEYRALSADASTNIGGSPAVACIDELGQVRGATSDFVDAITTAQAAHDKPLMFYISTQAPTDADMLSIAIDDAMLNKPLRTVCHVYTADADCDVMDEQQWQNANPALGIFRGERDMREQAMKADRMPSFENTYRNLLLNQRVASFATFIAPSEWRKCNGAVGDLAAMRVYGGLDLSSHLDLTALALIGIDDDGAGHVRMMFWTPERGLHEREKTDKAPYTLWQKQGILNAVPSANIDYDYVAQQIEMELMDSGIKLEALAFDRWRIDLFNRACADNGISFPLVEFGQGFKDMGPALDKVEEYILNGNLRHGDNPLLNMCAINSVAVADPAGNRKLEKRKSTGRIDGMVALAMAVGVSCKEDVKRLPTSEEIDGFLDSMEFI